MEIHSMDWMYDNDFMTYNQLIERFSLHDMRIIHDLLIKHKDIAPTINIDELG